MNQNSPKVFQLGINSLSRWVILLGVCLLLTSVGLGWILQSLLFLFCLILLAPIVIFLGFRWWLQRNLVQDHCPVCQYEFVGLNRTQFNCPNCNELLKVEQGHFQRLAPPGTIDVAAVEVTAQILEDQEGQA
ncbi:hypothetical protein BST81_21990 [Leptolyngbya sp. 'hensonii']|uniref:hypothetical protein n=1 Tax=Leptolyngbya sp. 'hensonii' TaxID=1922337 RepID=UPI00094FA30D|nr:hypothetical protein [Leptolyngbya sp. 'hensonii']OLP16275.1 hypothetical protein BST81_21990 [Leptolyngbya sp. 'hensonii']